MGSFHGGLHHLKEGRVHRYTTNDGLLSMNAWPLHADPDGTIWVGTPAGLNRIRGAEIRSVTQREGLYENLSYGLLTDTRSNYWSFGNRGIWRARGTELHAAADRKSARVHCVSYGETDGMASVEGNGDQQPTPPCCPTANSGFRRPGGW